MAHILVVDDELVLRRNVGRFLEARGHEVSAAADGKEALAVLDAAAVDLVITDINMPDMDGLELVRALRVREPPLPVVVMSGGGQFDKRLLLKSASMLGAVVALAKPFSLDELEKVVDETLAS